MRSNAVNDELHHRSHGRFLASFMPQAWMTSISGEDLPPTPDR